MEAGGLHKLYDRIYPALILFKISAGFNSPIRGENQEDALTQNL